MVGDSIVVWGAGAEVWATTPDGVVLWSDSLPQGVRFINPSVVPTGSFVFAIDALTGLRTAQWSIGDSEYPVAPIVDLDGTIYVQTAKRLVAFNPDFSVRWEKQSLGGAHHFNSAGGPALAAAGILYVNCATDVCAVNTADGSLRWRRSLPGPGSPGHIAIGPDSSLTFAMHVALPGSSFIYKLRGRFPLANAPWPMDGGGPARTRRSAP